MIKELLTLWQPSVARETFVSRWREEWSEWPRQRFSFSPANAAISRPWKVRWTRSPQRRSPPCATTSRPLSFTTLLATDTKRFCSISSGARVCVSPSCSRNTAPLVCTMQRCAINFQRWFISSSIWKWTTSREHPGRWEMNKATPLSIWVRETTEPFVRAPWTRLSSRGLWFHPLSWISSEKWICRSPVSIEQRISSDSLRSAQRLWTMCEIVTRGSADHAQRAHPNTSHSHFSRLSGRLTEHSRNSRQQRSGLPTERRKRTLVSSHRYTNLTLSLSLSIWFLSSSDTQRTFGRRSMAGKTLSLSAEKKLLNVRC